MENGATSKPAPAAQGKRGHERERQWAYINDTTVRLTTLEVLHAKAYGVDVLVSCGLWTMATGVSIIIRERFARYTVRSKCNLVIELQAMYFKTYIPYCEARWRSFANNTTHWQGLLDGAVLKKRRISNVRIAKRKPHTWDSGLRTSHRLLEARSRAAWIVSTRKSSCMEVVMGEEDQVIHHLFSSQFPLLPSLPLAPSEALSAIVLSATVLARDKYGRQLLRYAASKRLLSESYSSGSWGTALLARSPSPTFGLG
ncbi:hypothetical protein K443DRAFT_122327 [Laccaria amethystina LaAM-08-1]|uniref:Uncharacterized protein n=1 Tax=Laccaria amethystina LaAM-08-1 TaxID=1095629 RepID=A0A0C9XVB0_9AGAR|nr:hypothetical protein K443DRAFT_122327 [Laccaria amethystina LaAM-08-1]